MWAPSSRNRSIGESDLDYFVRLISLMCLIHISVGARFIAPGSYESAPYRDPSEKSEQSGAYVIEVPFSRERRWGMQCR